jgi:hypothetical protein
VEGRHQGVIRKAHAEVDDRDRRVRICEIDARGLDELEAWIASTRASWQRRFDAMERILTRRARERGQ